MSEPAANLVPQKLRVHVSASDAGRRRALEEIVVASGHALATIDDADVALSDGEYPAASVPVVALGAGDDDHAGLLSREASAAQIDAALRAAAAGLIVRVPDSGANAFDAASEHVPEALLTPRETEVLSLVADGLSNKEIARRLGISLHTVKFHIESLLRKLGARSRAEAVAKGIARRRNEAIEL